MPEIHGLIDLKPLSRQRVLSIFKLAKDAQKRSSYRNVDGSAVLLFLEPSTRTRVSFEVACHREGLAPVVIQGRGSTSLEKEETLEDTFLNLSANRPQVIIIRAGDSYDLSEIKAKISVPIINAGWGVKGHPTQALLDAYTLLQRWPDLDGKKLLLIGDVVHSRVAQSHFELAEILGYQIGVFAPDVLRPSQSANQNFSSMAEGLQWCDAVMALRTQKERHQVSIENFNQNWGLNSLNLKNLKAGAFIMHPGPVNWGIELAQEIKSDPRSIILPQAESGVFVRQALLQLCREGKI